MPSPSEAYWFAHDKAASELQRYRRSAESLEGIRGQLRRELRQARAELAQAQAKVDGLTGRLDAIKAEMDDRLEGDL